MPENHNHLRSKYSSMCQDEVIMEEEALSESKKNTPRTILKKEKKSKAKKAHLSVINELSKIEGQVRFSFPSEEASSQYLSQGYIMPHKNKS